MKVRYDDCTQYMMKFKDLPVGDAFVIQEVPETAAVYIKIEEMGVTNCVNVATGKLGCMMNNATVYLVDAELKWKYVGMI